MDSEIRAIAESQYTLYTLNKLNFCEVRRREGKSIESLEFHVQFIYLEMNGPNDAQRGITYTKSNKLKSFNGTASDKIRLAEILRYQANSLREFTRSSDISCGQLRDIFKNQAVMLQSRFKLKLNPSKAWEEFLVYFERENHIKQRRQHRSARKILIWLATLILLAIFITTILS